MPSDDEPDRVPAPGPIRFRLVGLHRLPLRLQLRHLRAFLGDLEVAPDIRKSAFDSKSIEHNRRACLHVM
ncbi:hypothetical protein AA309_11415 [Microvirga vignae]|uniref:Uncharacterized protein n=1 Tax=Microvirga vignae TaxID=1225564 RepID=A0A0H1RK54_9HYPH|nr:hypothetical protein AA309_11415 [Microvirga vignae]